METLCRAAAAQLLARLKKGVDREEIRSQFVMAAGMLALSMYIAASGAGEVTAFKAGNLSVERGGGESAADALRRQAELLLGGYIEDQGFAFECIDSDGACSCPSRGRKRKNKALCPDSSESAEDPKDPEDPEDADDPDSEEREETA